MRCLSTIPSIKKKENGQKGRETQRWASFQGCTWSFLQLEISFTSECFFFISEDLPALMTWKESTLWRCSHTLKPAKKETSLKMTICGSELWQKQKLSTDRSTWFVSSLTLWCSTKSMILSHFGGSLSMLYQRSIYIVTILKILKQST